LFRAPKRPWKYTKMCWHEKIQNKKVRLDGRPPVSTWNMCMISYLPGSVEPTITKKYKRTCWTKSLITSLQTPSTLQKPFHTPKSHLRILWFIHNVKKPIVFYFLSNNQYFTFIEKKSLITSLQNPSTHQKVTYKSYDLFIM